MKRSASPSAVGVIPRDVPFSCTEWKVGTLVAVTGILVTLAGILVVLMIWDWRLGLVYLGLLPLIEHKLVAMEGLIADCKSGVSGAGRGANVGMLMGEVGESFKAYAVPGHRHLPEIRQNLSIAAGGDVELTFVPHLLPMIRGIHATLYTQVQTDIDLQALYRERYDAEPFVDVMPPGSHPETRSVRGVNDCRIAIHRPQGGSTVVVLSVIDNLVKGAAGQAIQNMNLMLGFEERAGLGAVALLP